MVTVSSITKKQEVRLPVAFNMLIDEILTKFYLKHKVMDRSSFREEKLNSQKIDGVFTLNESAIKDLY